MLMFALVTIFVVRTLKFEYSGSHPAKQIKNLCRNYRAFLLRNVKLLSSFFNFLFPLFPKDLFPKKVVFPACFQGGNSGNRNWEQVETVDFTLFLVSSGNSWKQTGNRRWEQVETILSTKLALRKYRHRFFPVIKEI